MSLTLATALRSLLLPIGEHNFASAVERAGEALTSNGVEVDDHAEAVGVLYQVWSASGTAPGALVDVVRDALSAERLLPDRFAREYFRTHDQLVRTVMTFDSARGLLSNALLVAQLLERKFSCAQIANTLNGSQPGAEYSWQQVQKVARILGSVPSLNQVSAEEVTALDRELEATRFADASPLEVVEIISERAAELGCRDDLRPDLLQFWSSFVPQYSIILHANALAVEFYDHPPQQAAYEFQPRGGVIAWLQTIHPSYAAVESAYLNNSKAAYAFDSSWAWGRNPPFWSSAHALSNILASLGGMPYSGRRELSGWLRQWLLRIERSRLGSRVEVPLANPIEAERFIRCVSSANTSTSGVLDQRILDFIIPPRFENRDGWIARGVGDHVNATNTSRSKMGDLEFENTSRRRIEAYEAHGGRLSDVYVDAHRATLRNVLDRRKAALLAIDAANEWDIRITFVAHDIQTSRLDDEIIDGFRIRWEACTYAGLADEGVSRLRMPSGIADFNTSIVNKVSPAYVPDRVKRQYLALSGLI